MANAKGVGKLGGEAPNLVIGAALPCSKANCPILELGHWGSSAKFRPKSLYGWREFSLKERGQPPHQSPDDP
jgi:hypothetical protein